MEAFSALDKHLTSRKVGEREAAELLLAFPLCAIEDACRARPHRGLADALEAEPYQEALYIASKFLPGNLEALVRQEATLLWLRLRWEATGRHSRSIPPHIAATLSTTELHGYAVADLRLHPPALHLDVPAEAGLLLSDPEGHRWPIAGVLIVEETSPLRLWRIYVEAPTNDGRVVNVLTMQLPPGPLDKAVAAHAAHAVPAVDWRSIWTWTLGAVLTGEPLPPSKA
ncbi:hypothetical protein NVS55_40225 (plasmid) [Myxococcus stipitatus]|uniref:hypothetical protein n=1 Tax=Myxococcus stipitatus TaxID=83455 RepID=UPI003144E5AA